MEPVKLNIQLFATASASKPLKPANIGNKATIAVSFIEKVEEKNIDANTSTIEITGSIKMETGSYSKVFTPTLEIYWYDNNQYQKGSRVGIVELTQINKRATEKVTATIDVPHNDDGTLKGYAKVKYVNKTSSDYAPKSGETQTNETKLTTIPRASAITALDADIESATTINIQKAAASFTTTITYNFYGIVGTIVTKTSQESYGWIIPASFYSKIPASPSGKCTLTATTYNGDKVVGTKTTTLKVTANYDKCKPNIIASLKDTRPETINLTGNANIIVLNESIVEAAYTASAKNGSTIKKITINGADLRIDQNKAVLSKPNKKEFTFIVTDSREYTNAITLKPTTIDYELPTIKATFKRNEPTDGKVKLAYSGDWYNGTFGKIKNAIRVYYRYKTTTQSAYSNYIELQPIVDTTSKYKQETLVKNASGAIDQFNYKEAYDFQIKVVDALETIEPASIEVQQGIPIYWHNKSSFNIETDLYVKGKKITANELPIGFILALGTNTNPTDLLGYGTWERFAAGRVLVGYDANDADFNALNKTGGSKELQEHSHTASMTEAGAHSHFLGGDDNALPKGSTYDKPRSAGAGNITEAYKTNSAGGHTHTVTIGNTGTGNSGNLQPYQVVNYWIRTE